MAWQGRVLWRQPRDDREIARKSPVPGPKKIESGGSCGQIVNLQRLNPVCFRYLATFFSDTCATLDTI